VPIETGAQHGSKGWPGGWCRVAVAHARIYIAGAGVSVTNSRLPAGRAAFASMENSCVQIFNSTPIKLMLPRSPNAGLSRP